MTEKEIWLKIVEEAKSLSDDQSLSDSYLDEYVTSFDKLSDSIGFKIASDLGQDVSSKAFSSKFLFSELKKVYENANILDGLVLDLLAVKQRDPASTGYLSTLLFSKGFLALQTHRASHYFFKKGETLLANFLHSQASKIYSVDIHPAATIGVGVMLDHATGIVIGETSVIEDDVSIFQGVTLGGTGKVTGDRHPKVRKGVLISAGAKILGNVEIGQGAKVAAGSVVLDDVEMNTTVAGIPAIAVGKPSSDSPAKTVDHSIKE